MSARQASRTVTLALAIYRRGTFLLPRRFRDAFGGDLAECFGHIAADARRTGRLAVVAITVHSLLDLAMKAPRLHATRTTAVTPTRRARFQGAWQDVRYAGRRLLRQPSFTLATVVTLALGISAAISVYSLVHGVVLRPLPYPDSDRIVQVDHGGSGLDIDRGLGITYGFYRFYAERLRSIDAISMYSGVDQTLTGAGEPVQLEGARATPSLIDVLRVPARIGRWFTADEGAPGASPVVVLSDRLWRERFGADEGMLGRSVELGGVAYQVVGVMPPTFAFPSSRVAFWIPRGVPPTGIGGWNELAVARLVAGVDSDALEREIASLHPLLRETADDPRRVSMYLDDAGVFPRVVTLKESVVGGVRATLWILLGTVGLVLPIAVANVANLVLVRAEERQRETALRAALGANRGRLLRGSIAETLLLASAAGVIGIGVAAATLRVLRSRAPVTIPRLDEVGLDATIVAVALGVTLVAGLVLGLTPALTRRVDLGDLLKEGARRATAGRAPLRGRNVLVATQVALALVLLIGSGLLMRTFAALHAVDLGFTERQALVFDIGLPGTRYENRAAAKAFNDRLLDRLRALPGVESVAAIGQCLPLSGNMCWGETLEAEGRPAPEGEVPPVTGARVATIDYFRTMGISVRGRAFTVADERGDATAVILSESAAEAYFAAEDPVGRRVRFGNEGPWHTVVGVARDVRARMETDEFVRTIYLPTLPEAAIGPPPSRMSWVVATSVAPTSITTSVRRALSDLDPSLPLADVRTLEDVVSAAAAPTAFALTLIGFGAGMSLLLGAIGVYAVVAYAVSRRTSEIGVRLALGAGIGDVRWMVLRQGGVVVLAGIVVGLAAALMLTRLMSGMLFGVTPTDPLSYAALTLLMLAVAGLALYLPARRASRIDPLEALRSD